jgi:uncharacterized protein
MMNHDSYPQGYTQEWLGKVKTIAVVGASPNAARPSFGVMELLISRGYEVTPVNPGQAGKDILGRTVASALADLPGPVDMIDVFRGDTGNCRRDFGAAVEAQARLAAARHPQR